VNRFERAIPIVLLVAVAVPLIWGSISIKFDADLHQTEASAAGFSTYSDLVEAKAAGIKDPAAWAEQKRHKEKEDAAQRERITAAKVQMAAVAAKEAEQAAAARRELLRDPADRMKVSAFGWKKSGFGSVAIVTLTIVNDNDFSVKDIRLSCSFDAPSGTHLSDVSHVIYDTIKGASKRAFADVNIGFIHSQSRGASCSVVAASRL